MRFSNRTKIVKNGGLLLWRVPFYERGRVVLHYSLQKNFLCCSHQGKGLKD